VDQLSPLFRRVPPPPKAARGFVLEAVPSDDLCVTLLVSPPGSRSDPIAIWSRSFDTIDDRNAVLEASYTGDIDLGFLGRLTMLAGGNELDRVTDQTVLDARDARRAAAERAAENVRKHQIVQLYAPDTKRGHALELRRESRNTADWKVVYNRASERDRLCDWLRWQQPQFLGFLDYAADHGDEALTRLMLDEMFEAERRIKKEGRSAGGVRPLRMWRGD